MKAFYMAIKNMTAVALAFLMFASAAQAAEVTLAWDANSEDNLAGYKLYYKTDSSGAPYDGTGLTEGDSPVAIHVEELSDASAPVFSLSGLLDGTQYFFALTAFDSDGLESDYSDEASYETGSASGTLTVPAAAGEYVVDGFRVVVSSADYEYSGNIDSMIFHAPGCRYFNCASCTDHFENRDEAIAAGYRPCGICKP